MIAQEIIKIASNTKFAGLKNQYTHKSSIKNSLCGDFITMEFIVNKKKIKSMRYETESCILCEASASLLANKIQSFDLKNLKNEIKKFKANKRIFSIFGVFLRYDNLNQYEDLLKIVFLFKN